MSHPYREPWTASTPESTWIDVVIDGVVLALAIACALSMALGLVWLEGAG